MSSRKLPVFNNLKAWFSSGVPRTMKDLWKKQGGEDVSCMKDANFIFSNDANCPDTVDIYESEEFLQGFLTVFHTNYIDACMNEKTAHEVAAAQYILLPPDMADDIQKLAFVCKTSNPKSKKAETIPTKKQEQSRTSKPSTTNENTNTNYHQQRLSSESCNSNSSRDPPSFAHAADIAFRIDDLASVPYTKSLPRFEGDVTDFIPGVNGCSLSLKSS